MYDYLIVGAGIFGAAFAHIAKQKGKTVLMVEKRHHIAGNCYTELIENVNVHKYGAHIFHTSDKEVWKFVNQFAEFNNYINSPIAFYKGKLYNLPFNMNTFYQLWGTLTPIDAKNKIDEQRASYDIKEPKNLEEQALILVGSDIYEKLIKGYSEKQWGVKATEIPASIIRRLPLRFTYDNNYFNDTYQGIPIGGYTKMIERMLRGVDIRLNTDYLSQRDELNKLANKVIYTGTIDSYFQYNLGALDYRSLKFEHQILEHIDNYQGNAVINYTDANVAYTRIIEHKHFEFSNEPHTVITREFPTEWSIGDEPYYPVNDNENQILYEKYQSLVRDEKNVTFGGRLGEYKYYDMDKIIEKVLTLKDSI